MVSCFLSDKKVCLSAFVFTLRTFDCEVPLPFYQFYGRKSCREMLRRIEPGQIICYNELFPSMCGRKLTFMPGGWMGPVRRSRPGREK